MKCCPVGAIVNRDELRTIADAIGIAIQHIDITISSEERPNKRFHDAEYRQRMKGQKELRKEFMATLKRVDAAYERCS
ncbi:MAG TPA: hypothetical protein VGQ12_07405 [Candidatus Angelobacter sp.]|jgi:hypothetical protein|nr:hypothetical protein [Candidatus Angelobacter sp.]